MENNSTAGIETWGGGSRKQKAKASKLSLITQISVLTDTKSLDINPLSIRELESVLAVSKVGKLAIGDVPTSRFKAPYIAVLSKVFPQVQLDKLSVAALRELLGAFNEN